MTPKPEGLTLPLRATNVSCYGRVNTVVRDANGRHLFDMSATPDNQAIAVYLVSCVNAQQEQEQEETDKP